MANPNKVAGLTPVKYLNGSDWDGKVNMYYIDSATEGNAMWVGDPVKLSGSGDATRGIPGITLGTAGATAVGVVIAFGTTPDGGPYVDPDNLTLVKIPATKLKNYYAAVVDDPNVIFEIQEGGIAAALTAANIGQNANFAAGTPAAGVNVSGFYMDNNTVDVTATLNLKLLGLVRRVDNAFGAYAKWLVTLNNHAYRTGIAGV